MDDYRCAGVDFRHGPDMVLPKGEGWDDSISKKYVVFSSFLNFLN